MSCFLLHYKHQKRKKKYFDQNRNYAPLRYLGTFDFILL